MTSALCCRVASTVRVAFDDGEVDARSTELDELRTALEDAKCEALEAAAAEAEAAEVAQACTTTPVTIRPTRLPRLTRTDRA